jgi:two-component system sensor histidine kinase/response regulator
MRDTRSDPAASLSLHRFLTRLIWLCVLPLVLLATGLAILYVHSVQDERDLDAEHIAKNVVAGIDEELIARISALNMLVMSPLADQPAHRKELYQEAQAFRQGYNSHVIFADLERHMLFNTRVPFGTALPMLPQSKGRNAALTAKQTGKPAVGDIFPGQFTIEPLVAIAVPGLRAGKITFLMVSPIETRYFLNRIEQMALPSGWSLTLLDGIGGVIARRGSPDLNTATDDGSRRFVVKSSAAPWSVVVGIPGDIYRAPLLNAAAAMLIAILGATLAGVLGGKLASRRLGRSVASLADTAAPKATTSDITEIAAVRRLLEESVDERGKAEAARRDSEQRFRATFEQAAVGLSLVAPEGRFLLANQKLSAITGYPHNELLGKTFADITHPDDLDASIIQVHQLLAGEIKTYSMEKRYICKDGSVNWINLTVALARRPDGSPDYFIAVTEDIQHRKETEFSLQTSDATLREAQRMARLGHWDWDLRTARHVWSEEIYRIYGRDPSLPPAAYPDFQAYFTPDSWSRLAAHIETALAQGTPYKCDAEVVRADGTRRWIVARGEAKRDTDGTMVTLHGTLQDITGRKQAEALLRASEVRYHSVVSALSEAIVTYARDGSITAWNAAAERMLGLSGEQIQGRTTLDPRWLTIHEDGSAFPGETRPSQEVLRTGAPQLNVIMGIYRPDRTLTWVSINAVPIFDHGDLSPSSAVLSFSDITERKLAEGELLQHRQHLEQLVLSRTAELAKAKEDAEAANLAKGTFLATMSHELRTPLNAVVGLAKLLSDSPLGRRQRDYADNIQLSAQALRVLIDDILDFSKIEAGALRLEQAEFSLNAILQTTAAVVGVGLCNKPIEALFDVPPDIPDALIGDALRLQQILLNLTSNAVKFTETGVIVVSVRCLAREAAQVTLQFAVRDSGIGIPSEQLGAIFESFTQADTSISRMYGGSGLGLAIGTRLVNLMGGQIGVDSEWGQGSEFRFSVTLALANSESPAASQEIPSGLSILIIDDHPLARDILTQTCVGFGWQVTALDSGAAGLAELQRSAAEACDYDLMMLDWRMPGMDGIEMLRQAYATPGIGLPLVVLMASIFELEQAVAASDDLYLDGIAVKPMTPASLYEVITRAYSGEFIGNLSLMGKTDRRLAGMRLLVAEDNELNQEVIEQILIRAGAEVVIAANGLAAVAALRLPGARFDAVLMDVQMPVMDGYTATRIIREDLGLIDLPIIAVTASARPEDREKARLAGMVGHIVKPLNVEDLLDLVAKERQGSANQSALRPDPVPQTTEPVIHLAGLDVAAALKNFGGDAKRYGEILRKFVVCHGGDVDEARRLFSAADAKGAISLLHGLSGMASILRATELARLTVAAEGALLDGYTQGLPGLFDELQDAVRTLEVSIDQIEAMSADA